MMHLKNAANTAHFSRHAELRKPGGRELPEKPDSGRVRVLAPGTSTHFGSGMLRKEKFVAAAFYVFP